jgi:hypothetical protein
MKEVEAEPRSTVTGEHADSCLATGSGHEDVKHPGVCSGIAPAFCVLATGILVEAAVVFTVAETPPGRGATIEPRRDPGSDCTCGICRTKPRPSLQLRDIERAGEDGELRGNVVMCGV